MKIIKAVASSTALIWLFLAIFCCSMLVENSRAESVIFSVYASGSVSNDGTPPSFTIYQDQYITKIKTYHWNDGYGATPGSIGISGLGSWNANGESEGGVSNAYWVVYPNVQLSAGTYTITSDPSTWSQNSGTGGVGFSWVFAS